MSEKQINKMMVCEGLLYGVESLVYGILLSFIILILIKHILNMAFGGALSLALDFENDIILNISTLNFNLPIIQAILAIFVTYAVIFLAMFSAKRRLKIENIIDVVRDENI